MLDWVCKAKVNAFSDFNKNAAQDQNMSDTCRGHQALSFHFSPNPNHSAVVSMFQAFNLINSKLYMDCSHSALKSSMASGQKAHQPDDELALAPLLLASYLAAVGDESGPGGEEPALWLVSPL